LGVLVEIDESRVEAAECAGGVEDALVRGEEACEELRSEAALKDCIEGER